MPRRLVVLLGLLSACFASCAPRDARLLAPQPLDGYRAVYRIEERAPGSVVVRTEVREVRRPFDGRVEARDGAPPGRRVRSGSVVNRAFQWSIGDDGDLRVGFRRPPGGPVADASYAALRDAARAGAAQVVGRGDALGRSCTWFAYAEPTGSLTPATNNSRVESCIDRTGILLRQVWTIDDTVARIVDATDVTTAIPRARRFLTGREPRKDEEGLDPETLIKSVVVVDDEEDPAPLAVGIDAPPNYDLRRDAVVAESAGEGATPSQTFVEAYVRGSDLVVVERSTNPQARPLWSVSEGKSVDLGRLGEGRLVYFVDRVELRLVGTLGFARIRAPSREAALLFGRALRPA